MNSSTVNNINLCYVQCEIKVLLLTWLIF